jgi:DNA helicase-2/ATP-dependent DNA helicase PcrA
LAVVRLLSQRGGTLFVVGDDDQSIYGFRYANPVGIRQFPEIYHTAARLQLSICYRCDKSIIRQAEFVADQDMQRLPKSTKPRDDANDGEVVLVQCTDQDAEAKAVANRIKLLIDGGVAADKIVILSKTRVIFGPIKEHVEAKGIKVSLSLGNELMATPEFRAVLSMLRLLADEHDSLALRTLIKIEKNGLGDKCVQALWQYASGKAVRLAVAIGNIRADPSLLGSIGAKVKAFRDKLETRLKQLKSIENVKDVVEKVVSESGSSALLAEKMRTYFSELIN